MKVWLALPLVVIALAHSGCVTQTEVAFEPAKELRLTATKTGLLMGPCGPAPGQLAKTYEFELVGDRAVYTEKEFAMFTQEGRGQRFPMRNFKGVIEIDRAKRLIRVDVSINGTSSPINGNYRLAETAKT